MTALKIIAQILRNIGYGVKLNADNSITVWESWEKECLNILGVKTFLDGLDKRNNQIEAKYDLVCVSRKMGDGSPKISESVFKPTKNQTIQAGDFVRVITVSNPYVSEGEIMKVVSVSTVEDCFQLVSRKGHPYIAHRRCLQKIKHTEPETVKFT